MIIYFTRTYIGYHLLMYQINLMDDLLFILAHSKSDCEYPHYGEQDRCL